MSMVSCVGSLTFPTTLSTIMHEYTFQIKLGNDGSCRNAAMVEAIRLVANIHVKFGIQLQLRRDSTRSPPMGNSSHYTILPVNCNALTTAATKILISSDLADLPCDEKIDTCYSMLSIDTVLIFSFKLSEADLVFLADGINLFVLQRDAPTYERSLASLITETESSSATFATSPAFVTALPYCRSLLISLGCSIISPLLSSLGSTFLSLHCHPSSARWERWLT